MKHFSRLLNSCLSLMILCICLLGVQGTLAEEKMKMVPISDRDMSISVPESFATIEKNDKELDSRLEAHGKAASDLRDEMQANGDLLYAFAPDFQTAINVSVVDISGFAPPGIINYDFLISLADYLIEAHEINGAKVEKTDIRRDKDLVYLRIWLELSPGYHTLQYATVIDSETFLFTLTQFTQEITSEDEELLDRIVTSSKLNNNDTTASAAKPIENDVPNANYYHDSTVGLSFVIPNGWEQVPITKETQTVKFDMRPSDGSAVRMNYATKDIWSSLPETIRRELGLSSRNDLDSLATAELYAVAFGIDKNDIEIKQYAGKKFGIWRANEETSDGNKLGVIHAVTFRNGNVLGFQYMALDREYDEVFDKVLNSIVFD